MDGWKQYVFSLIICSLSCGIILQIISDPKRKALMHLVCGTVLAVSILRPLSRIDLEDSLRIPVLDQFSADYFLAEGKKTALKAREQNIKGYCEAYILEKAKALDAEITAHVSLDEDLIPIFVEINGVVGPNIQMQLQNILTTDLGIPKENQKWIWNQESNSS